MSFNFSSSSSGFPRVGGSHPHDMTTHSQLNSLYNQPVVRAELVNRPFPGSSSAIGPFSHSGARVTLEDGSQFLIHKGDNFGKASQTVVVDATHMSNNWKVEEAKSIQGKTVSDFVKAGGKDYNLFSDKCHDGAGRMMK